MHAMPVVKWTPLQYIILPVHASCLCPRTHADDSGIAKRRRGAPTLQKANQAGDGTTTQVCRALLGWAADTARLQDSGGLRALDLAMQAGADRAAALLRQL